MTKSTEPRKPFKQISVAADGFNSWITVLDREGDAWLLKTYNGKPQSAWTKLP